MTTPICPTCRLPFVKIVNSSFWRLREDGVREYVEGPWFVEHTHTTERCVITHEQGLAIAHASLPEPA